MTSDFDQDAAGRILLRLVEKDGRSVSALSASDGTLRFLAILAAIFGPEPASFYFIEELENGIHPTRLGLLVDLIEHQAKRRGIQIVATSHSPQLLAVSQSRSPSNTPRSSTGFRIIRTDGSSESSTFRRPAGSSRSSPCGCCTRRAGSRMSWISPKTRTPNPSLGTNRPRKPKLGSEESRCEGLDSRRGFRQGRAFASADHPGDDEGGGQAAGKGQGL